MTDHMEDVTEQESEFDVNSLVKRHKKYIKNVEKSISNSRNEVAKALAKLNQEKEPEVALRLKTQLKQLISIETLYLNLTLLILVPAD